MRAKGLLPVLVAALAFGSCVIADAPGAVAAGVISPSTLATAPAHVGDPYQSVLSFSGSSTWGVARGKLPPGLSLTGGVIAGVPTLAGAYTFTVQAKDGGASATKGYTIFVSPPPSTGYDERVNQELVLRSVGAQSGSCNKTGDLSNAIATIQLGQEVADANARLASIKVTDIGDAKSCNSAADQSMNNLMLSLLVRPYMLYGSTSSFYPGLLTTAAENNLVAQMWAYAKTYSHVSQAPDSWKLYGSENHDAQAESFYYLAAQIFSHRADYRNRKYNDGSTVAQQLKAWHDHWSTFFDERAKRGLFVETGAPTYHGYTVDAILNIYNFSDDPALRLKAGMLLDLDFADFAQQELNNVWGGAKSRSYPPSSYDGVDDDMTLMATLLFGPTQKLRGDNHVLMLASSGYYPPPVVTAMVADRAGMGSYSYVTRRPGVGPSGFDENHNWSVKAPYSLLSYAYCTPQYVMGTTELKPGTVTVAPSRQNRWQGIIFDTTSGDRVYPQAGPSSFSPANDSFLSVQHNNVLITAKKSDHDQPTWVYFPNTLDTLAEKGGWIFVKEGGAYLAVKPVAGGYQWLTSAKNKANKRDLRFIQLRKLSSPIIFDAALASSSTFAAFQTRILHNALSVANGNLNYKSSDGTRFTFFGDLSKAPQVNGQGPGYSTTRVFNSPFMQSTWGSGKITITYGGHGSTYDFSHRTAPTKSVH
jgi:hypothetical protein